LPRPRPGRWRACPPTVGAVVRHPQAPQPRRLRRRQGVRDPPAFARPKPASKRAVCPGCRRWGGRPRRGLRRARRRRPAALQRGVRPHARARPRRGLGPRGKGGGPGHRRSAARRRRGACGSPPCCACEARQCRLREDSCCRGRGPGPARVGGRGAQRRAGEGGVRGTGLETCFSHSDAVHSPPGRNS